MAVRHLQITSIKQDTALGRMPLWKWSLLLTGGLLLTFVAYVVAGTLPFLTDNTYIQALLFLLSAAVLTGIYWSVVKLFGKRKSH